MRYSYWMTCLGVVLSCLGLPRPATSAPPDEEGGASSSRTEGPIDIEALLARFSDEPSVRAVQRAALRHSHLDDPHLSGGRARARWSNLVPVVDGEMALFDRRDTERSFHEDIERRDNGWLRHDDARNEYADDTSHRQSYSLELEFDLRGLIFDDAEIDVVRASRERLEARARVVVQATKLYFKRRKRQVRRLLTPRDKWRKQLKWVLAIRRYTARLDALTGGWFSRQLEQTSPGDTP